jgi:hypothetical protein
MRFGTVIFLLLVAGLSAKDEPISEFSFQNRLNGWLCGQAFQMKSKVYETDCVYYHSPKFPKY